MTLKVDFVPLPHLQDLSQNWQNIILEHCYHLSKIANMTMDGVLNMPISFENVFYQSEVWSFIQEQHKAEIEEKKYYQKVFNEIIKALNNLGEVVSRKPYL